MLWITQQRFITRTKHKSRLIMYWTVTDKEQETLMDLVIRELTMRGPSMDNYNVQEVAYRQAVSDGAMRTDNYFNK